MGSLAVPLQLIVWIEVVAIVLAALKTYFIDKGGWREGIMEYCYLSLAAIIACRLYKSYLQKSGYKDIPGNHSVI